MATWAHHTKQVTPESDFANETVWLYNRVNEAIGAWGEFAERRLIVLIRSFLGGLWEDKEVEDSLKVVPAWWTETQGEAAPDADK